MADVILQQRLGPNAEAAGAIQHAPAPSALVDQAIGGAGVGQAVEGGERRLDVARTSHVRAARKSRAHNGC